ncbi:hypothetical protein BFW87_21585 [Pseudomonas fluorescens]|uniref:Uncharacterized protein n=2 Tax=Pseudomonas fluorescens TaxID=294 RepID=A0A1T2YF24_PSEFL|nr:hypothetical protein BFW87_21585 [Pseudomonas fluorescens]
MASGTVRSPSPLTVNTCATVFVVVAFQTLSQGQDMTVTSFQSRQTTDSAAFSGVHDGGEISRKTLSDALSKGYAEEARRIKAFVGQRHFQPPVAGDFARGMLASADSDLASRSEPAWAALINRLLARWRGQRPG